MDSRVRIEQRSNQFRSLSLFIWQAIVRRPSVSTEGLFFALSMPLFRPSPFWPYPRFSSSPFPRPHPFPSSPFLGYPHSLHPAKFPRLILSISIPRKETHSIPFLSDFPLYSPGFSIHLQPVWKRRIHNPATLITDNWRDSSDG